VVKHVDAAELRVVAATKLAAAADAVPVAHHLPKLGAHLVTALARLHVHDLARRNSLEAGSTREKRAERSGETSDICFIFVIAMFPLQFAKAKQYRDAVAAGENNSQMYSAEEQTLPALSKQWQISPRGDVTSTSSGRWP
jgi:hypothetical protein